MKRLILFMFVFLFSMNISAQNVKVDKNGNYTAITKSVTAKDTAKPTGKTYTDSKGKVYPVHISARGKLFIIRTSAKSGKTYKFYLKLQP